MTSAPASIRALSDQRVFDLRWPDGTSQRLPFRLLREHCPCAGCVNEFTGERMLDPATIPDDIRPAHLAFSGNYALKITWSDGHDTGIYTWERLRSLGERGT